MAANLLGGAVFVPGGDGFGDRAVVGVDLLMEPRSQWERLRLVCITEKIGWAAMRADGSRSRGWAIDEESTHRRTAQLP